MAVWSIQRQVEARLLEAVNLGAAYKTVDDLTWRQVGVGEMMGRGLPHPYRGEGETARNVGTHVHFHVYLRST